MVAPDKLQELYQKYGREKVDETIKYLSYKKGAVPMQKQEEKGAPLLYVFRHGQTTDNADMLFSGWRDVDLTEKGIEQALILADKIKDVKFDMLIASDQLRAIKTMELAVSKNPYAKDLEIIRDARIKERCYGDWQGISKLELLLQNPEARDQRRNIDFVPPNGESMRMVINRVNDFLNEVVPLIKEHKLIVGISCHGNSIRAFRKRYENLTDDETESLETALGQDYGAYHID